MPPLDFAEKTYALDVNGISMRVYENGKLGDDAIIFCHGFPELAYSWRHQLKKLGDADFRAIAPDLRGYGETEAPAEIDAYRLGALVGDMNALLDELDIEKAIFVGHDMGSLLAYAVRAMLPHRCRAVVSLNVPMRAALDLNPIETLSRHRGAANYMVAFQKPMVPDRGNIGVAEKALSESVETTFKSLMRTTHKSFAELAADFAAELEVLPVGIFVGAPVLGEVEFLTPEEIDTYVQVYTETGFTGGINWYRNLGQNWREARALEAAAQAQADAAPGAADAPLEQPAQYNPAAAAGGGVPILLIRGLRDPVIRPEHADWMINTSGLPVQVADLECGHWTQQEKPDEVSDLIQQWVADGFPTGA